MNNSSLYLDLSAGVAGDMLLGALVDLNNESEKIEKIKEDMGLQASIEVNKEMENEVRGSKVNITFETNETRHLSDIENLLDQSSLKKEVILRSKKIFKDLAEVEAEIHGLSLDEIHFHEVGAVDSILDIVGVSALIEEIDSDKILASKINVGRGGFITCAHGKLPNPAPATVKLLRNIPIYSTIEGYETATPTGVVLIKNLVDKFGIFPSMKIKKIGRGIGDNDLPVPDFVTVMLGEG